MKNKDVLILTFHFVDNYGALLQAYALQKTLMDNNRNVSIYNYKNKRMYKEQSLLYFTNNLKNNVAKILLFPKNVKRKYKSYKFRRNYFNISNKTTNNSVFVLGSDQIWNPSITYNDMTYFSKGFNIPAISYAASFGKELPENKKEFLLSGLEHVQKISVREETAKKCIKDFTNRESQVVLDPTMLLKKEDWVKIAKKPKKIIKNPYIFVYTVDGKNKEFIELVNKISEITNLPVVCPGKSIYKINNFNNIIKTYNTEGPEEFLYLLNNAEFVVTSSFHGTVFSLLFEKQFVSFVPSTNASRLIDLMKRINCSYLLLKNATDFNLEHLNAKIDFNTIKQNINKEREISISWLLSALS